MRNYEVPIVFTIKFSDDVITTSSESFTNDSEWNETPWGNN